MSVTRDNTKPDDTSSKVRYALIKDGEIERYDLPRTGRLKDGRGVSNYHKLSPEILKNEGWLPIDDPGLPKHDPSTQMVSSSHKIYKTKVSVVYSIENIPKADHAQASSQPQIREQNTDEIPEQPPETVVSEPAIDTAGFFIAIRAALGRERMRELMSSYPDIAVLLKHGSWSHFFSTLEEALAGDDLSKNEMRKIKKAIKDYNIPLEEE